MHGRRDRGFTLIELVITLVISAIVVSFVSMFISGPVRGFTDQTRRARLVDAADTALQRMSRDVRRALPNSVRVTTAAGVTALELLGTIDGARYRAQPPGTAAQILDFAAADGAFDVLGPFTQLAKPWSSTSAYLAIYNVGVPGADAYELANVITPAGTTITVAADGGTGEDRVTLTPAFRFAYGSPTQRVFLVDGPVTYLCDPVAGTLLRYSGYTISPSQANRDSAGELLAAGATQSLMANQIGGCVFTYTAGTAERAGLVTLQITISSQGESVSLLQQVHVDNAP
ncbi:MAG TPA: type II secretion system protein [Gammaproteobacteria bacterium]|nr:type II secretion system protein [Gammaproteobacteria bacterium]